MRRFFGKIISKLYWKYGREYDDNTFWTHVVAFHVGKYNDGKVVVAEINRVYGNLDYKAESKGPTGIQVVTPPNKHI